MPAQATELQLLMTCSVLEMGGGGTVPESKTDLLSKLLEFLQLTIRICSVSHKSELNVVFSILSSVCLFLCLGTGSGKMFVFFVFRHRRR